jgi:hypothetical protein
LGGPGVAGGAGVGVEACATIGVSSR